MRGLRTALRLLPVLIAIAGCGGGSQSTADEPMAIGRVDRARLLSPAYPAFKTTYDTVTVVGDVVDLIRASHAGVETIVLLGTWCGDSKREVPRFLRVADMAGIPADRITLVGVDRAKKSGDGMSDRYPVEKVPTFIFLKGGVEIGRIVETPAGTLEGDMLTILARAQTP